MAEPDPPSEAAADVRSEPAAPDLPAKVGFLSRPEVYPDQPGVVERVETHMSWVFLTERYVYKLKKPVRSDNLDLRTVAARRANCVTELLVNRRFAPSVYLGLVPLTRESDGFALDGTGPAVDWLVKMRRLPAAQLLDQALRRGTATRHDVRRAAAMLSRFYRAAPSVDLTPTAYLERLDRRLAEDAAALVGTPFGHSFELAEPTVRRLREVVGRCPTDLILRGGTGRVIEGHGDLRPEHVHVGEPALVIDSLEFDRGLRLVDPVDELSYLAMECEGLGASWVGTELFDVYEQVTGDTAPAEAVHLYAAARACLRARLSLWHLRDAEVAEPQRWPRVTRAYLQLAAAHAEQLS